MCYTTFQGDEKLTIHESHLVFLVGLGHEVHLIPELLHDEDLDPGQCLVVRDSLQFGHGAKVVQPEDLFVMRHSLST